MRALGRIAGLLAVCALTGVGCVSGSASRETGVRPLEGGGGDFYARVTSAQETMVGQPDMAARIGTLNAFRQWLQEHTAAYERALVNQQADTAAQPLYDEMMALQVTLNHIPRKPFHPEYCEIVRNSIHVTWAPHTPNPATESFARPVREGLRFLDLLCAG